MSRTILSLDQSLSNTGWCLFAPDGVSTGNWPLCEGVRMRAWGYRELEARLDAVHRATPLSEIVHEEVVLKPTDKRDKLVGLFGLVAVIELYAVKRRIAVTPYASDKWRGTFFSAGERKNLRGKDWKRAAIERCRQLGRDPNTDDEAEAFAILDHHLHCKRIMPPWRETYQFLETVA